MPRLVDLCCKAGGASAGYAAAGFDVVGVDIEPQPHYPFKFVQADALEYLAAHGHEFDTWAASPPCRDHTKLTSLRGRVGNGHLLADIREAFQQHPAGRPWVIENVPGAPMRADYRLCGCLFDLPGLRRERWFETSWRHFELRSPCHHRGRAVTVVGHPGGRSRREGRTMPTADVWARAMGIDWMTAAELAQAIPPAYTEHIGRELLVRVTERSAAA